MINTNSEVLDTVIEMISRSAGDWEYSGPISAETYLLADLGYESLDLVVLGTVIEERYGRMAFAEFLAGLGQRAVHDVTIEEIAEFVCEHIGSAARGEAV